MSDLIYFIILLAVGYFTGTLIEKRHYRIIEQKEKEFLNLPAVTSKNLLDDNAVVDKVELVYGNIVVSTDYFKMILAGLRNILGGEVSAFETLLDRGRREAVLRLKEQAPDANIILNMRIETCQITQAGSTEVFAYGTAVYYKK